MIASPCINVCKMDAQTGLCTGCFRTLDEITIWSRVDDSRRGNILTAVAKRRLQHAPREGELHGDGDRHG